MAVDGDTDCHSTSSATAAPPCIRSSGTRRSGVDVPRPLRGDFRWFCILKGSELRRPCGFNERPLGGLLSWQRNKCENGAQSPDSDGRHEARPRRSWTSDRRVWRADRCLL